jgi:hypothetical protein
MAERLADNAGANIRDDAAEEDVYFGPRDAGHTSTLPATPFLGNAVTGTPTTEQPPHPAVVVAQNPRARPPDRRQSAIRLRRLPGPTLPSRLVPVVVAEQEPLGGRRRSSSEPQRPTIPAATAWTTLPPVAEAPSHRNRENGGTPGAAPAPAPALAVIDDGVPAHRRRRRLLGRRRVEGNPQGQTLDRDCYDSRIVDFLDVIGMFLLPLTMFLQLSNLI